MRKRAQQPFDYLATDSARALARYVQVLERIYPDARGNYRVATSDEGYLVVGIPLPKDADVLIRIFERMAEEATGILVETDQCIVLTSK